MAKRPHWTTEEVLEEIIGDEEPEVEWVEPITEDGRGEIEREEPLMEGSDEEFSDCEDFEEAESAVGVKLGKRLDTNKCMK